MRLQCESAESRGVGGIGCATLGGNRKVPLTLTVERIGGPTMWDVNAVPVTVQSSAVFGALGLTAGSGYMLRHSNRAERFAVGATG